MNGVLGMTELLLETGLTGTQRKYAETVQRSGKNLLGIINDVLDFSKIEAGKLELEQVDMDLRGTVEDVVELLAERAQTKGLELACNIPADIVDPRARATRCVWARCSPTSPATRSSSPSRARSSSASRASRRRERAVTLRFEVTDTGTGISPEAQARIFDDFSQADGSTTRKHGGSGLGLAISKQLVEMMGGKIHVESTLGVGSTFWFTSRFEKQEDAAQRRSSAPHRWAADRRARADRRIERDQPRHPPLADQQLGHDQPGGGDAGARARAAGAGSRARRAVRRRDHRPRACRAWTRSTSRARSRRARRIAKVRLVMLTPVGKHADIREAREVGIDACLVKPVRQTALYECLVNVMAGQPHGSSCRRPSVSSPRARRRRRSAATCCWPRTTSPTRRSRSACCELEGYNVTVVNNGREALEAHAHGAFDLVLMDCHMPEMDGFEATTKIRERERATGAKRVPIIALTANAMTQDRDECLNAGMDDHLSKPYGRLQMRDMLNRWMPHAGAPPAAGRGRRRAPPPSRAWRSIGRCSTSWAKC